MITRAATSMRREDRRGHALSREFERRPCRRNPALGEVPEGAVAAPSGDPS
jgi:hypothetical protein